MSDIAVVTGANRGLGLGVARTLAERGYTVVLSGRDEPGVKRAAQEVAQSSGAEVVPFRLDVTDDRRAEDLAAFLKAASAAWTCS